MSETSYTEFSHGLHGRGKPARVPLEGAIEVSHRCPLVCQHCYNNLPMGDAEARKRELTLDEHTRLLDEITEAGCLWLLYTGGEIFARPDFLEIYTRARQRGLLITLFTNATLITPKIADHLARYRPFTVEVTLYGATRETYEELTQVPGSYDRCLRGIRLLQERDVPLRLKTVAVKVNRHEVWQMKQLAEDMGLEFKFDGMMSPRIDCSRSPLAVRLSPEEVVAFDRDDPERAQAWYDNLRGLDPMPEDQLSSHIYHCGGGVNAFAVDPYGQMSICTLSHSDKWDLRKGSFREGWDTFLAGVRRKQTTLHTKCVRCQLKAACSMCPANGELENGNPESPVDFLCQVGHLRAAVFGDGAPEHGDCEYCAGGARHEWLNSAAARLLERPEGTLSVFARGGVTLPMLGQDGPGSRASGCGSCGIH